MSMLYRGPVASDGVRLVSDSELTKPGPMESSLHRMKGMCTDVEEIVSRLALNEKVDVWRFCMNHCYTYLPVDVTGPVTGKL